MSSTGPDHSHLCPYCRQWEQCLGGYRDMEPRCEEPGESCCGNDSCLEAMDAEVADQHKEDSQEKQRCQYGN